MSDIATVIMAAGRGTRMNDPEQPKVMFEVGGRPMIAHVIDRALDIGSTKVVLVVGHQASKIEQFVRDEYGSGIEFTLQEPQLGTGHAVMQATPNLREFDGIVVVLSGDVPLLRTETLHSLIEQHQQNEAAATVITVKLQDPHGYGRVIRSPFGNVIAIIEHKDATDDVRNVKEINSGIYAFNARDLFRLLPTLSNDNAQSEYYLPDVVKKLIDEGKNVDAFLIDRDDEIAGINDKEQLAEANERFARLESE